MASSRDWMFCPISGALLTVDPRTGIASCTDSNYNIDLTSKLMISVHCYADGLNLITSSDSPDFYHHADLRDARVLSSSDIKVTLSSDLQSRLLSA